MISIDTPGRLLPTFQNLKGVPFRTASRLRTLITRSTLENGGILCWENQVIIYPPEGDGGEDTMHVDTWPKRGINQEGNQVKFGKKPHETLSPVAMSQTWSGKLILVVMITVRKKQTRKAGPFVFVALP